MKYATKLDSMSSSLYRYLNFDELPEFTEKASEASKVSLPIVA